jgi:hypothetical protein
MALQSRLFAGDPKLEAAAVSDPAHIVPGARGPHVGKIQKALIRLDGATIAADELDAALYGTSTANAVLSYKQQRAIINRSYQSSADNIVGKMTIAALDREAAQAELTATIPVILPIAPPPRPLRADFLVETQRSQMRPAAVSSFGFVPVSSGSTLASLNLFGDVVPKFPGAQIEIDAGDTATFRIVGGKGERVFVENFRVGLLLDPQDGQREKVQLDITDDNQSFQVKGKTPGATRILATKHEGFFDDAGTVAMGLVVNEMTVAKLWRPSLVPFREPPRKRSPFMLGDLGEGVQLSTEMFKFDGFVEPRPEIDVSDFEIGFVQTLTESMMEALYTDDAGGQRRIFESTVQRVPVRDSKGAIPWTGPDGVKELAASKTVHFEDRPSNVVPWQSADKRVTLRSSSGSDKFTLFFIARQKSTRAVTILARVSWQTSWEYAFNFAADKLATPVGQDGSLGDVVIAPVGGIQPILAGPTALETLKAGFRP